MCASTAATSPVPTLPPVPANDCSGTFALDLNVRRRSARRSPDAKVRRGTVNCQSKPIRFATPNNNDATGAEFDRALEPSRSERSPSAFRGRAGRESGARLDRACSGTYSTREDLPPGLADEPSPRIDQHASEGTDAVACHGPAARVEQDRSGSPNASTRSRASGRAREGLGRLERGRQQSRNRSRWSRKYRGPRAAATAADARFHQ